MRFDHPSREIVPHDNRSPSRPLPPEVERFLAAGGQVTHCNRSARAMKQSHIELLVQGDMANLASTLRKEEIERTHKEKR